MGQCKKIRTKFAKIKKFVTRTPVIPKRSIASVSKKYTSGEKKKLFFFEFFFKKPSKETY
jgi:hypothetical protein